MSDVQLNLILLLIAGALVFTAVKIGHIIANRYIREHMSSGKTK